MIQFRCVNFEVLRDEAVRSLFTPAIAPLGEGSEWRLPPNCDLHRRHPRRPLIRPIAGVP